jgi:hypothetical protein
MSDEIQNLKPLIIMVLAKIFYQHEACRNAVVQKLQDKV